MEADEGQMLTLGTNHPLRSHEHLSLFLTFSEPLLKTPNSELKASEERVQRKSKEYTPNHIQISKGNEWNGVSKNMRDLFTWMILFQPELIKARKIIT